MLRRYVEAAALTAAAYGRLIDETEPAVLVAHHGIYTPQGLAVAVARKGVRVVTWDPAYRRHCFIFSHDDSYRYTLMDEPVESWRDRPFSEAERAQTLAYLRSRRENGDWIKFHRDASSGPTVRDLGLDPTSQSSPPTPTCSGTRNCISGERFRQSGRVKASAPSPGLRRIPRCSWLSACIPLRPAVRRPRQRAADVIAARF
ncbi:MAG: hypothetical protein R3C16_10955 [Hyphomonadaceae bacterium]